MAIYMNARPFQLLKHPDQAAVSSLIQKRCTIQLSTIRIMAYYLSPNHVPWECRVPRHLSNETHDMSAEDWDNNSSFLENCAGRETFFQFNQFRELATRTC